MAKLYEELEKATWPEEPLSEEQRARIVGLAVGQIEKEENARKRRRPLRWSIGRALAAAAVICCLCAGGVAAAGYFLSPADAARQMEQEELAALFETEQSICIESTQQADPYTVTLLGITTGANVTEYWSSDWENVGLLPERSYAVLAIAHTDGTPMAELSDTGGDVTLSNSLVSPLFASPDCPIMEYNVFTMNGARHDIVQDGIRYILVETDTVEPFADKDPKLAVVLEQVGGAGALFSGFSQDADTGVITPTGRTDGIYLLFDLPIPEDRADPEQAEKLRRQWVEGPQQEEATAEEADTREEELWQELMELQPEEVRAQGTLQSRETVSVTTGIYGTGWYYGDGGFQAYSESLNPEEEEKVSYMCSDDGQAILVTRKGDILTVEHWLIPLP